MSNSVDVVISATYQVAAPAKKSWIIHELFMNYFMSKFMNNSWIIHQH